MWLAGVNFTDYVPLVAHNKRCSSFGGVMLSFLKRAMLCAALIPVLSHASVLVATDRDAKSAYDESMKIYRAQGLTGLIINSKNCHSKEKNKIKCVYLDIVGLRLDMAIVVPVDMPRHPYFDTDAVFMRSDAALRAAGVPKIDRPELFGAILERVRNYL